MCPTRTFCSPSFGLQSTTFPLFEIVWLESRNDRQFWLGSMESIANWLVSLFLWNFFLLHFSIQCACVPLFFHSNCYVLLLCLLFDVVYVYKFVYSLFKFAEFHEFIFTHFALCTRKWSNFPLDNHVSVYKTEGLKYVLARFERIAFQFTQTFD